MTWKFSAEIFAILVTSFWRITEFVIETIGIVFLSRMEVSGKSFIIMAIIKAKFSVERGCAGNGATLRIGVI